MTQRGLRARARPGGRDPAGAPATPSPRQAGRGRRGSPGRGAGLRGSGRRASGPVPPRGARGARASGTQLRGSAGTRARASARSHTRARTRRTAPASPPPRQPSRGPGPRLPARPRAHPRSPRGMGALRHLPTRVRARTCGASRARGPGGGGAVMAQKEPASYRGPMLRDAALGGAARPPARPRPHHVALSLRTRIPGPGAAW